MITRNPVSLTVGAIAIAALTLAGCSSATDSAGDSPVPNTPAASAPADAPEPSSTQIEDAAAAPVVGAGGQCAIDAPGVKAIVVQGSIDCGTLDSVWARAVADPNFATHGHHNTIVVDDWTCRAHQVSPIATGFCEDAGYQNKFKIVRAG